MKPAHLLRTIVPALPLLVACSGSNGNLGDAGAKGAHLTTTDGDSGCPGGETSCFSLSGPDGGPTAGVTLAVDSSSMPSSIMGDMPAAGDELVLVTLTLGNDGAPMPLMLYPQWFSITTTTKVSFSAEHLGIANECDAGPSVDKGGMITCSLAFEIQSGQTPATLTYDDGSDVGVAAFPK